MGDAVPRRRHFPEVVKMRPVCSRAVTFSVLMPAIPCARGLAVLANGRQRRRRNADHRIGDGVATSAARPPGDCHELAWYVLVEETVVIVAGALMAVRLAVVEHV
jgi:hypothetical protein